MISGVNPSVLNDWLDSDEEIAILDVRELGEFSIGHLFFASHLPYSRLEVDVQRLVPHRSTKLVVCAGDSDIGGRALAQVAAERLGSLGYSDIHLLNGGVQGWEAAGFNLFEGVNVPSKTFGELVEQINRTPKISASELAALQKEGGDVVVLDGRPLAEFKQMNIPGARCCPNGELAYRIGQIAPDQKTKVVINCAGRTRSLIGAQTLINVGIPNPVYALENGTQGWFLADLPLDHGRSGECPEPPNAECLGKMRRLAATLAAKFDVPIVETAAVDQWLHHPDRTVFLFDVRTEAEYHAKSLPGALHAPGGQLVQATDEFVGVRNARLVLFDSDGIRALTTASWLKQMGWDVSVLKEGIEAALRAPVQAPVELPGYPLLPASELMGGLASGAIQAYDLRSSADYQTAHIAGTKWSIRPVLWPRLQADQCIVLISDDADVALLAAGDLERRGAMDVRILSGGLAEWVAEGLPIESSPDNPPFAARIDYLFFEHQLQECKDSARRYLSWETGLVARLSERERRTFQNLQAV